MSRLTNKDDRGRYYTVEEKILIANEPVNPTTTWIVHNENRRYGSPIDKLGKLEDLEEQLGCPLEVLLKLVDQNELYYQFFDELQHWTSIKVDLRKKVVWYCKQVGGHYACSQPLSNYGKTFWLKEDRSE